MKIILIALICTSVSVVVFSTTINNVRLIGHDTYIVSLIEETMRKVEEREWCNLKVNDIALTLQENVIGSQVVGRVEYTNGFVVSIQWIDIIRHTVQQAWRFDRVANRTTVEVRAAMRLHSVTLGFDVHANLAGGEETYTATYTHPLLQFDFMVIKDMNHLEDVEVTVSATVIRNTNVPRFLPQTKHSEVFASLFDWNSTTVGIRSWATDVFQPIAYELASNEIQFPRICYNCPVVA